MEKQKVIDILKRFNSIVIWGLKSPNDSTHRHIHRHLFTILKKIGCNVIWCDNNIENNNLVNNGSLIISANQCCNYMKYRRENYYALFHTCEHIVECKDYLKLRVYGEITPELNSSNWDTTTIFNKHHKMLYQSFVTDLLPEEFLKPVFNTNNIFNWVGSIWNDSGDRGNIKNIDILKNVLQKNNITFINYQNISDEENISKIRESRIAPAIGGGFQVEKKMMPCRIWKNISYGQLGITNLKKALDIFNHGIIFNININDLIEYSLTIKEKEYRERTLVQQEIVSNNYTYLNWFYNIGRAFEEMSV